MKICILAVTNAFDKYCIAGMDEKGTWVRPISSNPNTRFWKKDELTFDQGYGFIRAGDVLEFNGSKPSQYQHRNHTEDIVVQANQFKIVDRLNNQQLINFLKNKDETQQAFIDTVNAQSRSLCLVKVNKFQHQITQYPGDTAKPKMTFTNNAFDVTNPKTSAGNYIVKDCKWSNVVLNQSVTNTQTYIDIYLSIGLATPTGYDGVEYPQVIGLHTNPEVTLPNNYPNNC